MGRSGKGLGTVGGVGHEPAANAMERLEQRVLLAGDHFSLNPSLFPMHPASDFMLDSEGRGALNGIIQAPGVSGPGGTVPATGDDDMFRFIAPPGANFVSLLADTVNVVGGSALNSRVRVYSSTGDLLETGTNNGVISTTRPGVVNDGWVGFIANPGETYYVQVSGENATLGGYILRVNAQTTTLSASTAPTDLATVGEVQTPVDPNLPGPLSPLAQHIDFPQDERIYRVTAPDTMPFDSLATASARADRVNMTPPGGFLDTHLEIYDAEGNEIASDIETGFLNDAFATWRAQPGETYYIRVRGDDLRDPASFPSVGTFQLRLDLSAKDIPIDEVTRRGVLAPDNTEDVDESANVLTNAADTGLFRFTAQGTGVTFITAQDVGPPHNLALRVFRFDGTFVGYNNDFSGNDPQIELQTVGGETYFVVVDGFPDEASGAFNLWIEAYHNLPPNQAIDDHVDFANFGLATALRFADPELFFDGDVLGQRNPIFDRTYVQTSVATGRIDRSGDSDLFQFTPPVDMLSDYAGNNDDVGAALFTGGQFTTTDPDSLWPRESGAVGVWDAGDWWFTGRQGEGPDMVQYGFQPNSQAAAEVYTMLEYDPAGPLPPRLYVGGDFTLVVPNPMDPSMPIVINNLAFWAANPVTGVYGWNPAGNPDGAVRAMSRFTPGDGGGGGGLEQLVVGGDFDMISGAAAAKLAVGTGGAFAQLGGGVIGANASVKTLAQWDPPDPGAGRAANMMNDPPLQEVVDPQDPPNTLFIGGSINGPAYLEGWDGTTSVPVAYGEDIDGAFPPPTINGASVNAITVYQGIDPDGDGPMEQPPPTLIIAGDFTSVDNGIEVFVSPNIIAFGRPATAEAGDPMTDPEMPDYAARLLWEPLGGGTNGPVNALTVWDQPEVFGDALPLPPVLVVGGAFTAADGPVSNLASWNGVAWNDLGGGVDGPVHSLTVSRTATNTIDDQEPGIPLLGVEDPQEVLYVGGSFAFADPFAMFPTPAQNVVQRAWTPVPGGFAPFWSALDTGTNGPVFALQMFDDQNPATDASETQWDRNDRPGSRMNISVAGSDGSFIDAGLRIYDSNLNLIYPVTVDGVFNVDPPDPDGAGPIPDPPPANNRIVPPPFTDPAGMIDPSSPATGGPGTPMPITGVKLWGGETYYIEIVALGGSGRYTMNVTIDALPPDLNGDGLPDAPTVASWIEVADEGNFGGATNLNPALATGDTTNFVALPTASHNSRTNVATPSRFLVRNFNELGAIEEVEDTDLYSFIAEESGWVEVRLNTTNIRRDPTLEEIGDTEGDSFLEQIIDTTTGEIVNDGEEQFRIYNSPLDGLLRVFNNDFEQVTFADSFPGIGGTLDVHPVVGEFRFFGEFDPRVVFRVVRGERYFVQVESTQKAVFEQDPDLVDWRYALGSYELTLDAMPSFQDVGFEDDHSNFSGQATPIPIGLRDPVILGEPDNGRGSVTGRSLDTVLNPNDIDTFFMYAVASGTITATVTATNMSGFRGTFNVFNGLGMSVGSGSVGGSGVGSLTWVATQGDLFTIELDGTQQGTYRLDIAGQPYLDDHAEFHQWIDATELPLNRFFGTASASGVLESPADTDLFYFDAENYEVASVTVDSISATLEAGVLVYEVGKDGADNDTFLLLNFGADGFQAGATATFSTTPGRRYYFVVQGVDGDESFGAYNILVNIMPTDDHPDIGDPQATQIDIAYNQNLGVGDGSDTGLIEREEDSDLFFFVAPIAGDAEITVNTTEGTFPFELTITNAAGDVLGTASGAGGTAVISLPGVLQTGNQYFIAIEPGMGIDPADFPVAYEVQVSTSPTDDHADAGQFPSASQITIAPSTAVGTRVGALVPFTDTDLFYFDTLGAGQVVVEITTPNSGLDPQARIFNDASPTPQQIAFGAGNTELVVISFTATAAGQRFYVLVEPDANAAASARTGEYVVRVSNIVSGGGGGGGDPDDHANEGDFDNASPIRHSGIDGLEVRTGNGSRSGVISFLGDTDLFVFTTIARGDTRINLTTPQGSPLNGSIRVFDSSFTQVAFNATGIPGVTASTSFIADSGQTFYVLVEQVGANLGAYSLQVDAAPPVFYLYYPEGYSAATIDEFVPIVNPNAEDVTYTIYARYEVGERDQILAQGVIPANSRGGITISNPTGGNQNPMGIRLDEPYAIEIQSSGQLGATMSHYDFGVTTGESFTERTSTLWTFSEGHKDAATFRDFLVYYNPNNIDGTVTVTLTYDDGSTTTFTRDIAALRRGGVNFDNDGSVTKSGVFSVKVESTVPLVAAMTSYDILNGRGYGLLGNPDGGATRGVIPSVSTGSGVDSSISIYNGGTTTATVTLRGTYQQAALPELVRTITVGPGGRFSSSLAQLGLIDSQVAGLRYDATAPVTVTTLQYRSGDGDATTAPTHGVTSALIGDAFINPQVAGITYIEELALYNPASIDVNITITFLFSDGTVGEYIDPNTGENFINLGADSFGFIRIDQQASILSRPGLAFFSIRLDAPTPFVASFNHYDLFLNGGWGALPSPVGPTIPLSRI